MAHVISLDLNKIGFTSPKIRIGEDFISDTSQNFHNLKSQEATSEKEVTLSTRNREIRLIRIVDAPYNLLRSISLDVEIDENGDTIVSSPELNIYGVGETVQDAVNDFSSMLIDVYEELETNVGILSNHLQQQLISLQNKIF